MLDALSVFKAHLELPIASFSQKSINFVVFGVLPLVGAVCLRVRFWLFLSVCGYLVTSAFYDARVASRWFLKFLIGGSLTCFVNPSSCIVSSTGCICNISQLDLGSFVNVSIIFLIVVFIFDFLLDITPWQVTFVCGSKTLIYGGILHANNTLCSVQHSRSIPQASMDIDPLLILGLAVR